MVGESAVRGGHGDGGLTRGIGGDGSIQHRGNSLVAALPRHCIVCGVIGLHCGGEGSGLPLDEGEAVLPQLHAGDGDGNAAVEVFGARNVPGYFCLRPKRRTLDFLCAVRVRPCLDKDTVAGLWGDGAVADTGDRRTVFSGGCGYRTALYGKIPGGVYTRIIAGNFEGTGSSDGEAGANDSDAGRAGDLVLAHQLDGEVFFVITFNAVIAGKRVRFLVDRRTLKGQGTAVPLDVPAARVGVKVLPGDCGHVAARIRLGVGDGVRVAVETYAADGDVGILHPAGVFRDLTAEVFTTGDIVLDRRIRCVMPRLCGLFRAAVMHNDHHSFRQGGGDVRPGIYGSAAALCTYRTAGDGNAAALCVNAVAANLLVRELKLAAGDKDVAIVCIDTIAVAPHVITESFSLYTAVRDGDAAVGEEAVASPVSIPSAGACLYAYYTAGDIDAAPGVDAVSMIVALRTGLGGGHIYRAAGDVKIAGDRDTVNRGGNIERGRDIQQITVLGSAADGEIAGHLYPCRVAGNGVRALEDELQAALSGNPIFAAGDRRILQGQCLAVPLYVVVALAAAGCDGAVRVGFGVGDGACATTQPHAAHINIGRGTGRRLQAERGFHLRADVHHLCTGAGDGGLLADDMGIGVLGHGAAVTRYYRRRPGSRACGGRRIVHRQRRGGQQAQAQSQTGQNAEQSFFHIGSSSLVPVAVPRPFPETRRLSLVHTPSREPGNW